MLAMSHILRCVVLAVIVALSSLILSAQTSSSQLTGILTDPAKALIAGAQVTLTNVGTGAARSTTSNSDGNYTLVLLEPGTYKLRIQKSGFETIVQEGLKLDVAQSARLDR